MISELTRGGREQGTGNRKCTEFFSKIKYESYMYKKTIENGWKRNILNLQIQNNIYNRQGKAITNFNATLSSPQSDLARETLKNPYIFDFLTLGEEALEREVEKELIKHITNLKLNNLL